MIHDSSILQVFSRIPCRDILNYLAIEIKCQDINRIILMGEIIIREIKYEHFSLVAKEY